MILRSSLLESLRRRAIHYEFRSMKSLTEKAMLDVDSVDQTQVPNIIRIEIRNV